MKIESSSNFCPLEKSGRVTRVGIDDSSNYWPSSSVGERLGCHGVVPGSKPGPAFLFSSYNTNDLVTCVLGSAKHTVQRLTECLANSRE